MRDKHAPKQPPRPAGPPVARVASGATVARTAPQRADSSIQYAGVQEAPPGGAPQLLPPVHLAPEPADVEPIESPPPIEPRLSPLRPSRRGLSVARNPAPGELTADIALPGDVRPPDDLSAAAFARNGELRFGPGQPANSLAYNLPGGLYCHRPLYFEEFYLERYGRSFGIFQPAVSAAHFFATVPAMPYMMTARPPGVCSYVTGIGPGGQWYPTRPPRSRFSLRGALVEAGVITGLVFILP